MSDALVLVCRICRWRPPPDLQMTFVQAHFDVEPDHDPDDIKLELTAWCDRCDLEMALDRTVPVEGGWKHYYGCGRCHRSSVVAQRADEAEAP